MSAYVPLRMHSEFSIGNGAIRLEEAVARARQWSLPALGLTDDMNVFGLLKFYKACRSEGVKPILGADIVIRHPEGLLTRALLLIRNHAGYLRLSQLLTGAYVHDNASERTPAYIHEKELEGDNAGLIMLSGAAQGEVGHWLAQQKFDQAQEAAKRWAARFEGAFYLELQRLPERPEWEDMVSGSLSIAAALDLPVVATHPAQFLDAEDFEAHEVRVCIAAGETLANPKRVREYAPSQYFCDAGVMAERFSDIPSALQNSVEIARRCTLTLTLGKNYLPDFPTPHGESLNDYLCDLANSGLDARMLALYQDEAVRKERYSEYRARLDFELDTIIQMGFAGYFLIVADFINWAKTHGCPVGPGRGSGAGSLVAYALGVTDLDPLRYALLFERFLNPERVSMPDFDIDFCQENRGRVIDYVRQKYGAGAVSQIVTFGTLSSKAVIRDVGRVLDLPYGLCERLSKLVPVEQNRPVSLARAVEMEPQIRQIVAAEEAQQLLDLSLKLEDLTRGVGMHAGGVLIAPGRLTDFCAVYQASGHDTATVSMFDKDDVEEIGLVKFDFLGLRNLTIIELAQQFIRHTTGRSIDVNQIPLDDSATYARVFATANTTAIFQFESAGMKKMLAEAKPTQFEEIIAFVALYRPGPMDLIPDFIARMHGAPFDYLHPLLQEMLAPTYGIMVYQEQVMQAAQLCAGYSLGGADLLRRAMGKKKPAEMAKQRDMFVSGAAQKNIPAAKANEIFDFMEKFAGYGFNKSHAAAYALVAYQTAWLKHHYPAEFMAATLSSELDNTDQLRILIEDAKANGITFLPPDINESDYRFTPLAGNKIRYALGAVKGTGEAAVEAIVQARAQAPFTDLFDFCERVGRQAINKRAIEALVRAGAFDRIERNRAQLLGNVDLAMDYAEQKSAHAHQGGLFDLDAEALPPVQVKTVPYWADTEELAQEKLALGLYFSAHPFTPFRQQVREFARQNLADIRPDADTVQLVGGFVTEVRSINGRRGRFMVIMVADETAQLEIRVTDEILEQHKSILSADQILIFSCKVRESHYGENGVNYQVQAIYTLPEARMQFARALTIRVEAGDDITLLLAQLDRARQAQRTVPFWVEYEGEGASGSLKPAAQWTIAPTPELLQALDAGLGPNAVRIQW